MPEARYKCNGCGDEFETEFPLKEEAPSEPPEEMVIARTCCVESGTATLVSDGYIES